jgi:uncharacterized protein (DUF433 family)
MRWGKEFLLELEKGRAMAKEYVEKRNGGYYIAGTRVSLDSIVYDFLSGSSAEAIQQAFSTVSLEEVYGAITFYLANRSEVEEYLAQGEKEYEKLRLEAREKNPLLYQKLEEARRNAQLQKK